MGGRFFKGLSAGLVATVVASSATVTLAREPDNDSFTPNASQLTGDWEILVNTTDTIFYAVKTGTMDSNSDVDYTLVTCGNRQRTRIQAIKLGAAGTGSGSMPGDFDVYVYDPQSGTPIASGTNGGTAAESVDISAFGRNTVVAKVIRYAGVLGNYGLRVECAP